MDQKIKEILKYGTMAPSGDNSQPWKLEINGNIVCLYNLPDKDNPYLNVNQSGSMIAHGAFLENIKIASCGFGLRVDLQLFPEVKNKDFIARMVFSKEKESLNTSSLFGAIKKRVTNRKPYKKESLPVKIKEYFFSLKDEVVENSLIQEKNKMKKVSTLLSVAEVVILENKKLHQALFKDVVWSEKDELQIKSGLYIETMEFNFVQRFLFKTARSWSLMKIANKIKFAKFIARQDSKIYSKSSGFVLFSVKKLSLESFVLLGMKMQNFWLKITSEGLWAQPVSALLFLGLSVKNKTTDKFIGDNYVEMIRKAYDGIFDEFNLSNDDIPLMILRVGFSDEPSAKSSRKDIF